MKTISRKEYDDNLVHYGNDTLLWFHIGRGGQFYNPGYISFEGICKGIDSIPSFCELFSQCDEEGNDLQGEWEYKDETGDGVGLTSTDVKSGVGHIVLERGYNEDYVIRLGNCGDEEVDAILQAFLTSGDLGAACVIPTLIVLGLIPERFKENFIED